MQWHSNQLCGCKIRLMDFNIFPSSGSTKKFMAKILKPFHYHHIFVASKAFMLLLLLAAFWNSVAGTCQHMHTYIISYMHMHTVYSVAAFQHVAPLNPSLVTHVVELVTKSCIVACSFWVMWPVLHLLPFRTSATVLPLHLPYIWLMLRIVLPVAGSRLNLRK